MPLQIFFDDVSFAYQSMFGALEQPVLSGINLRFHTCESIGLVGASGSGKTTLLQLIAGLERPTRGKLRFQGDNRDGAGAGRSSSSYHPGMVFQFPEQQLFAESIFEDVAFGLRQLDLPESEIRARVQNSLSDVGLDFDQYAFRHFETLSQGEKRRVAIASILVLNPEILLLDEPTAGLDQAGKDTLITQLRAYVRQRKRGLLIASHDIEFLLEVVHRLWVLHEGRLAADLPVQDFPEISPELGRVLPAPRAARLAEILRRRGFEIPKSVMTQPALLRAIDVRLRTD